MYGQMDFITDRLVLLQVYFLIVDSKITNSKRPVRTAACTLYA